MTHKIQLVPGEVSKGPDFTLRYQTRNDEPVTLSACKVGTSLATLQSPSGTGKSTLLEQLVHSLRDSPRRTQKKLDLITIPRQRTHCVGVVPQNPPFVRHWSVSKLLPAGSSFAQATLPGIANLHERLLGQLSGGQQRRVYASSVLEQLRRQVSEVAILILDETLDGLGPKGAGGFLNEVAGAWKASCPDRLLSILLVTHLPQLETELPRSVQIELKVVSEKSNELCVNVGEA